MCTVQIHKGHILSNEESDLVSISWEQNATCPSEMYEVNYILKGWPHRQDQGQL